MHKRVAQKGLAPMERRVPKSEKYAHVRGTIDTGMTVDKVKFVTAREYSKRRDEIFFRITKQQLYQLLAEYEGEEFECIQETSNNRLKIVSYTEFSEPVYEKPYLLLDVREIDSFNQFHILQARSFPYQMLRRDLMHPEIYRFRNKPDTLVVLCCEDEKMSRESAKVLVDRGVDNVYLLTGGINEFAYEYPSFIEGMAPIPPKSAQMKRAPGPGRTSGSSLGRIAEDGPGRKFSSADSDMALTPGKLQRHNRSYAPSAGSTTQRSPDRGSRAGYNNRDNQSDTGYSMGSTKSVAESIISRAASRKGKF
ncbi:Rhodanese-like domain-containing protein [Ochromonadaceae sp. CCMP2298]|nr:Rhodanese-like domain-containing protein [Ochromonadaceae sp. CCMP2298]